MVKVSFTVQREGTNSPQKHRERKKTPIPSICLFTLHVNTFILFIYIQSNLNKQVRYRIHVEKNKL